MSRNARIFCFLAVMAAALGGCSSGPTATEIKKAARSLDKIQGKAQVQEVAGGASDAALNAGGPTVFLKDGMRRYRLFLRAPADVQDGKEYVVEGVNAQKAIDEIGDPDSGASGYPLQSSCDRVVRMAWTGLSMDAIDADTSLVCTLVKRYPARPIFLVAKIRLATEAETSAAAAAESKQDAAAGGKEIPEVTVAADKQRASLIEGPTVLPAPLWEPTGGAVSCKVIIGPEGKVTELLTGVQLCESVPWSQFKYQPPMQGGHPVTVKTEVEVRYDARK